MWAAIVNIIIGLFLMIVPALFRFEKAASDQYYIVAPVVITFAVTALWEVNRSARYFNIPFGAWLAISAFIFNFQSSEAKWVAVISGLVIVLLSMVKGKIKGSYGGGWRSLRQDKPLHMQDKYLNHG